MEQSITIETKRFGKLSVQEGEWVTLPQGILGFSDQRKFCLVDPGDDTLILWLQAMDGQDIAFPILEPKIFKGDYRLSLSASELKDLQLDSLQQAAVYSILTIPEDVTQMTANLKAPLVLNLQANLAKQVILQENEYAIKHPMFKELRVHLMTLRHLQDSRLEDGPQVKSKRLVPVRELTPSFAMFK